MKTALVCAILTCSASSVGAASGCPFKPLEELESSTSESFVALQSYPLRSKPASALDLVFEASAASYDELGSWVLPFKVFDGDELVADMVSLITCDETVEFSVKWRKKEF